MSSKTQTLPTAENNTHEKKRIFNLVNNFGLLSVAGCTVSSSTTAQKEDNPLANTTWVVESYGAAHERETIVANSGNGDPATGFLASVQFFDSIFEGRLAGCNISRNSYAVKKSLIKIRSLSTTAMACSDEIMQQERELQTALETADSFRLNGDRLELSYDTDKIIILRTVEPTAA